MCLLYPIRRSQCPTWFTDERSALLTFLAQQRHVLRIAAHGLSDEQATAVPTAGSSLSVFGLIKHTARTEKRWLVAGLAGRPLPGLWPIGDNTGDFVPEQGETLKDALDYYDETARLTEEIIAEVIDLGEPCAEPQAAHWSARWVLLHMIEETARHAGHADIIRESIDGATAGPLLEQAETAHSGPGSQEAARR